MKVRLTYFKPSGTYYSDGEYDYLADEKTLMLDIWQDVAEKLEVRQLPGLIPGHDPKIVLVDVPDHPNNHPHLVMCRPS